MYIFTPFIVTICNNLRQFVVGLKLVPQNSTKFHPAGFWNGIPAVTWMPECLTWGNRQQSQHSGKKGGGRHTSRTNFLQ